MANICIHCFVSGKVQGVFFRYSTKVKAEELGLTGWVRNLQDNRVELIACGEEQQIKQFYDWLNIGPSQANVTNLERTEVPWQDFQSFESKRSPST